MTDSEILERANNPSIPTFNFGSRALEEWNRKHRDQNTGRCILDSGCYVVVHSSLNPKQRPDFRTLQCWNHGFVVPHSWDVPATAS